MHETDDARRLEFIIKDEQGNVIIHRHITFPYIISAERIDAEIAMIFVNLSNEKAVN